MITSSFAANEKKLPVNVPKASASVSMEKDNMTVQVTKTGDVFIAGKSIDSKSLNEQIKKWVASSPDRPVMVEADEGTNYGKVISVLDQVYMSYMYLGNILASVWNHLICHHESIREGKFWHKDRCDSCYSWFCSGIG